MRGHGLLNISRQPVGLKQSLRRRDQRDKAGGGFSSFSVLGSAPPLINKLANDFRMSFPKNRIPKQAARAQTPV